MSALIPIRKPYSVRRFSGFGNGPQTVERVILHDTESPDAKLGWSDCTGVVNYWRDNPEQGDHGTYYLAAHFVVNKRGYSVAVDTPETLLYHCQGANTGSIGIEQIGYARFTREQWMARPGQLRKVAKFLAWSHKAYGVPMVVSVTRGVSTHKMQTDFHHIPGGHTDPGAGYPLQYVVDLAQRFVRQGGWWY